MKNIIHTMAATLCLLLVAMAFQACASDGDETIALEFGNVKEMIVGEWIVEGGSRVLTFTDDGYYTDSSDGGTRKHSWRLDSGYSDGAPYYGGIYLDGTYYDIESMGDGHWRLRGSDGRELVLNRDGGGSSEEETPGADSGGKGKLVSQIRVYSGSRLEQTITFYYDKNNRVTSADYTSENVIIGPDGYRVFFNVSGTKLTLSSCRTGGSKATMKGVDGEGYGEGTLNSMGLLAEDSFDNQEYELQSGDYSVNRYEHNSKGQCTSYTFYGSPEDAEKGRNGFPHTYTWEDGRITKITGNPGGANYGTPSYTDIVNKANLNLNRMIMDQLYSEDIYGLALCGYISTNETYLLSNVTWQLDSQGYATQAEYDGYVYKITYTK